MNRLKIQLFKCFCLLTAGFLLLCTGLTGCADREAQFLLEDEAESAPESGSTEETPEKSKGDAEIPEEAPSPAGGKGQSGSPDSVPDGKSGDAPVPEPVEIYVDVCGAVVNPGVYALREGSRVFQAVEAAGGYLPEAAQTYVNRARGLSDGQQVYIPTQQEIDNERFPMREETQVGPQGQADGMENASGSAQGTSGQGDVDTGGRVNLNTADEAALTALTGIGASKARAIIAYREANGPFQAIEDIMKVEGIKEGTFAKIKDDIVVG